MSDKIVQIISAPEDLYLVYLKDNFESIDTDKTSPDFAFDTFICPALALTEKGKVVGLDINPETGCLEIPDDNSGYFGLINPQDQGAANLFTAYLQKAKVK